MMRNYSKSGRILAGLMAVIFLMTSLLTFSVSADVSIAETSTATVAAGSSATINVAGATGTEQTTVLVYLGTPDDDNIIFIDQKAAANGTAAFTFKVPTTAAAGTYTVLAGSESSTAAGQGSLVVTAAGETPDPVEPTLVSIAVAADAKVAYTVGDEFVAPVVTATYSDDSTATVEATFTGYDMATAGTQTVTVTYEDKTTTYEITVAAVEPPIVENWAVVATRDADDTVGFTSDAFDSRWNGQTSADKVTITGASGQGLDGTSALGFNYARSGGWGGVQTGKTPSTVDWSKVKYVSFYARIIPTDTANEVNFAMRINGPNYNCSFDATTGWQYFEFDLTNVDLSNVGSPSIQWTQNKAGTGKLVIDNLAFSNYKITPVAKLLQSITLADDAKVEYTTGDEFVAPAVTATYSDETTEVVTDATIEGYDMATAGKQTVTVSYKGFTVSYEIKVVAPVKVVKSIAIADDVKKEYTVGDSFVAPAVTATYEDDTSEVVTGAAFSGYDMTTAGTQTVTVSYGGQTLTYEITVAAGEFEPWVVVATRDADDTVGFASDAFDGRWQGETSSDKVSNANGSGLGLNGTNSTAFSYSRAGGWSGVQTATLPSTVDLAKTTNVSFYARIIPTTEGITSSNFNINFAGTEGQCKFDATTGWQFFTFDFSAIDLTKATQLQVLVNTKNTGMLVVDNLTFSNYGVTPISPLLQSIAVSNATTEFELGAEFVAPTVTAVYNDATTAEVEATFAGYNMASNGVQTVTATYQGFTATYDIVVGDAEGPVANPNVRNGSTSAKATVSNSAYEFHLKYGVTIEPNTDYILSAWSKGSGSVILVGRLNGSWSGSDARNLQLAGGDNWKHNVVTFNSGAEANGRAIDTVTLCIVTNGSGSKGSIYIDDVFLAKASDPTVNLIPDPGFEIGEWGTDKAVVMETSELAVASERITLAAINSKTEYLVGDEFVAPAKVVIVKNDGTTEEVTGATIEGYDMATEGTQTVTVKYDNLTTMYPITVAKEGGDEEPTLVSIAVADDAVVEYTVGDEFAAPVVTATYSDDSTATVEATFTGYDMATAGEQTVTVTYEGVTTTYVITVKDAAPDVEVVKSYLDLDFEDAAYAQKDDGTGTMVDDYWNMITTNKATGNQVTVAFGGSNESNRYQVYEADGNKYISTKGRKTNITYDIRPEASVSDNENLVYVEAKVKRISYNNDDPVSIVFTDDSNNVIFRLNYKQNVAPVLVADATYETVTYPVNGDWTYIRAIIDFSKSTFELYQGASLDAMTAMVEGTTSFGFVSTSAANIARITNKGIGDTKGSLGFDDIKIYTVAKDGSEQPPAPTLVSIAVAADAKVEYTVGDEFVAPVVTATYSDDSTAVVEATFTGYDMNTAGTQTVTVTYEGVTTTYEITVKVAGPTYTAEVLTTEILDEEAGVVYVTKFTLSEGNGTVNVFVGDVRLIWSPERECYIGIIDAANYNAEDKTLNNVSLRPEMSSMISATYGDNSGDGRINNSDLAYYKNYMELEQALIVKLAADVNIDGRLDYTDLSILKDHIEKNEPVLEAN